MGSLTKTAGPCYSINLKRATNAVSKYYDKQLKNIGLTISQFSLLNDLHRLGRCSKSALAIEANLEKSTISRNLKLLEEKGLIHDLSQQGRRNSQIELTAEGRKLINDGYVFWNAAQKHLEERIGREQLQELNQVLSELENISCEE